MTVTITAERHVYGTIRGYGTLAATAGLSASDRQALELREFGTPLNVSYATSLTGWPAFVSRPLAGERRAITKIIAGPPDDAKRPTLRFISLVMPTHSWDSIGRDALLLVKQRELWLYDDKHLSPVHFECSPHAAIALERDSLFRVLSLVSQYEMALTRGHRLMLPDAAYNHCEAAAVEMLLPSAVRSAFSICYRGLTTESSFRLLLLSSSGFQGASALVSRPASTLSPYANALAAAGFLTGVIPRKLIAQYDLFGQVPHSAPAVPQAKDEQVMRASARRDRQFQKSPGDKFPLLVAVLVTTMCLVLGITLGWVAHSSFSRQPDWHPLLVESLQLPISAYESVPHLDALEQQLTESTLRADPAALESVRAAIVARKRRASQSLSTARTLDEAIRERSQLQTKYDLQGQDLKRCEAASLSLQATLNESRKLEKSIAKAVMCLRPISSRPAAISALNAAILDCDDAQLRTLMGLLERLLREDATGVPTSHPTPS